MSKITRTILAAAAALSLALAGAAWASDEAGTEKSDAPSVDAAPPTEGADTATEATDAPAEEKQEEPAAAE